MCTIVFSKAQLSKTSNLLCVRRPIAAKCSIYCLLRLWRKDKDGTNVFSKAQPSNTLHLLCVSKTQPNKVCTFVIEFESSTERSIVFTLFACVFEIAIERVSFEPSFFEGPAQHSVVFTVS